MRRSISLSFKLIPLLLIGFSGLRAQENCKMIKAEAFIDNSNPKTIKIDLKGIPDKDIVISIFSPGGKFELETEKRFFSQLSKGKYLIVFSASHEQLNYCIKEVTLTIQ